MRGPVLWNPGGGWRVKSPLFTKANWGSKARNALFKKRNGDAWSLSHLFAACDSLEDKMREGETILFHLGGKLREKYNKVRSVEDIFCTFQWCRLCLQFPAIVGPSPGWLLLFRTLSPLSLSRACPSLCSRGNLSHVCTAELLNSDIGIKCIWLNWMGSANVNFVIYSFRQFIRHLFRDWLKAAHKWKHCNKTQQRKSKPIKKTSWGIKPNGAA